MVPRVTLLTTAPEPREPGSASPVRMARTRTPAHGGRLHPARWNIPCPAPAPHRLIGAADGNYILANALSPTSITASNRLAPMLIPAEAVTK